MNHDPVTGTTNLAADLNTFGSSAPSELTVLDNRLYFTAEGATTGRELYVLDLAQSSEDPALVDINIGPSGFNSSYPSGFTLLDGKVYFEANDGISGYELWVYDPSTEAKCWLRILIRQKSSVVLVLALRS